MQIAIIGCGFIGKKRAESLFKTHKITAFVDSNVENAKYLADLYQAEFYSDLNDMLINNNIDIAIISTFHDSLYEISKELLKRNIHLLIEKPATKNLEQIKSIINIHNITL
jgi:predicted dehydrogenase